MSRRLASPWPVRRPEVLAAPHIPPQCANPRRPRRRQPAARPPPRPKPTFLGERNRRIVKHRGKLKALVAVARSILVIVWNLLSNPNSRFHDLGADYHTRRVDTRRKVRNHLAQLAALGYEVTLKPAA
jgi:hypothetical protein